METMVTESEIEAVKRALGFHGHFVVDPVGHGGGLALLWRHKHVVQLLGFRTSMYKNFILQFISLTCLK